MLWSKTLGLSVNTIWPEYDLNMTRIWPEYDQSMTPPHAGSPWSSLLSCVSEDQFCLNWLYTSSWPPPALRELPRTVLPEHVNIGSWALADAALRTWANSRRGDNWVSFLVSVKWNHWAPGWRHTRSVQAPDIPTGKNCPVGGSLDELRAWRMSPESQGHK